MTREEAIRILSNRDAHGVPCGYTSGYQEAFDMAIDVLKAEPVVHCRECKYSKDTEDYQDSYFCTSRTHAQDFLVHSYDYCSYGAKMDKEVEE